MVNTKNILCKMWKDRMTVSEYMKTVNPDDNSIEFSEILVLEDIPCKISFTTINPASQSEAGAGIVQIVKLFCDNTIKIKPGSKITVWRYVGGNYELFTFAQSGLPSVYTCHQEIMLVPFEGWA